jgi:hypothetical protein
MMYPCTACDALNKENSEECFNCRETIDDCCTCHNGHKQNNTVCTWCWARGRRVWNDVEVQGH